MPKHRVYKVDGVGHGRAHANEETNVFIVKRPGQGALTLVMPPLVQDIFKAATNGRLPCNPADRLPRGALVAREKNRIAKCFALIRLPLCQTRLVTSETRTCVCSPHTAWAGYRLLW